MRKVLLLEDDANLRDTFRRILVKDGFEVDATDLFSEAAALLDSREYGVIISDINLTRRENGIDLLRECRGKNLSTPVVIVTGYPTVESAAEAVRLGAYDYLCKPVERDALLHVARGALRHRALNRQVDCYRRNLESVLRSVSDAIVTVDADMIVTFVNQAAEGFCMFTSDSIDRPFGFIPDPELEGSHDAECRREMVAAVRETMDTTRVTERYKFECPQKGTVYSLKSSPLVFETGESCGAVVVMRDETRLDSLERDLKKRRDFQNLLIGKSDAMQSLYGLIEDLADIRSTVLILGESGTGKELVAAALHHAGSRRSKPLIKVNCSALSETVLESELFGHVRGAFTGATHDRVGRFEKANGGTLFLDEIGDTNPNLQQKLLRVLQEREFERVGDSTPIKVDVRIIAATNSDMKELVRTGRFREDLYYRLKVVELQLPALRSRTEDIPLLVGHFLAEFNREFAKRIEGLSADVLELFMRHPWKGNVRELRHVMEHAVILCRRNTITLADLPLDFAAGCAARPQAPADPSADPRAAASGGLLAALREAKWNKAETARALGISRQTLYRKLREQGIDE